MKLGSQFSLPNKCRLYARLNILDDMGTENTNYSSLVIAIIVIVVVALGWFLWSNQSIAPSAENDVVDVEKALENVSNVSNPAADVGSNVPETNPFEQTNTNPFKGYKNPFGN